MNTIFKTLQDGIQDLQTLLLDMDKCWKALGQVQSLLPELEKKVDLIKTGKIKGYIGYVDEKPVSIAWADLPQAYYGNMVVHCIDPMYRNDLVLQIVGSGMVKGAVVELVQLVKGFEYRDAFIELGFPEKERQRMSLDLTEPSEYKGARSGVTFERLGNKHIEVASKISCAAHSIRKKIEGYLDFETVKARSEMTQKLRTKEYGETVKDACLLMKYQDEPAGICEVIDIPCWGQKHVAWIMDVALEPKFQGLGLGKTMLQKVLSEISKSEIKTVGLSVTLSNRPALSLYEAMGFKSAEFFVEIIFRN